MRKLAKKAVTTTLSNTGQREIIKMPKSELLFTRILFKKVESRFAGELRSEVGSTKDPAGYLCPALELLTQELKTLPAIQGRLWRMLLRLLGNAVGQLHL